MCFCRRGRREDMEEWWNGLGKVWEWWVWKKKESKQEKNGLCWFCCETNRIGVNTFIWKGWRGCRGLNNELIREGFDSEERLLYDFWFYLIIVVRDVFCVFPISRTGLINAMSNDRYRKNWNKSVELMSSEIPLVTRRTELFTSVRMV